MRWIQPELRWLLRRARPLRELYTAQLSLVLLASLLALLDPLLIKWLIDNILTWRQQAMLPWMAATFFAVFLFQYGFASLALLIDAYARQRLTLTIRLALVRRLEQQSAAFFDQQTSGDLLHRVEQDVDQICELSGTSLTALLRVAVTTALTVGIMALLSWQLTLLVLPLVPIMLAIRRVGTPRLRAASDDAQQATARRLAWTQDHLHNIPQVQLLGRQAGERRHYVRIARRALEALVHRRGLELGLEAATQLTVALASALVLGFGGAQVLAGTLTIGGLVAFFTYLSRVFGPAQTLVQLYSNWQRAGASIRRVRTVLDAPLAIGDPPRPSRLSHGRPLSVELARVDFRYPSFGDPPGELVLDDLDLRIAGGERVALIGATGCGKSTIARLLTRTYDVDGGVVRLAGIDVRDLGLGDLRSNIALVPQEPTFFDTTLRANLLVADPRAGDPQLRDALAVAQLGPLIEELPNGLDSAVGARGSRLSGGQRQRLAIARAILQNPRLLILDEATSALDATTERRLLDALEPFARGRTVVVIAHRRAAIRWASRIVLLDRGRVAADGDPTTLAVGSPGHRRRGEARRTVDSELVRAAS